MMMSLDSEEKSGVDRPEPHGQFAVEEVIKAADGCLMRFS